MVNSVQVKTTQGIPLNAKAAQALSCTAFARPWDEQQESWVDILPNLDSRDD